jgi:hypothetical protein
VCRDEPGLEVATLDGEASPGAVGGSTMVAGAIGGGLAVTLAVTLAIDDGVAAVATVTAGTAPP